VVVAFVGGSCGRGSGAQDDAKADADGPRGRDPAAARTAIYAVAMTPDEAANENALLDEWREQLGDEGVAAVVWRARDQIAGGSLPGFSDKLEFLDYLRGPRRRSA
jgi:hypothetical protein